MNPDVYEEIDDLVGDMLGEVGCGCCGDWTAVLKYRKKLMNRIALLTVDEVCEVDDES